jgi:hypothetical protein
LMLAGLLFEPQPASVNPATSNIATASIFIVKTSFGFSRNWRHPRKWHLPRCRFFRTGRKVNCLGLKAWHLRTPVPWRSTTYIISLIYYFAGVEDSAQVRSRPEISPVTWVTVVTLRDKAHSPTIGGWNEKSFGWSLPF